MSERVRQSLLSSLFASKRFVVAACAAVAMVLGALSGGASFFGGSSSAQTPTEHSSLIFGPNPDEKSGAQSPTPVKQSSLTTQYTLEMRNVLVPAPNNTPITSTNKSKVSAASGLSLINPNNVASTVNALFLNEVQLPIGNPTGASSATTSTTATTDTGGSTTSTSATTSDTSSPTTTTSGDSTTSSDSGTTTTTTAPPTDTTTQQNAPPTTQSFTANNAGSAQPPSTNP